jgi:hypothetical protein
MHLLQFTRRPQTLLCVKKRFSPMIQCVAAARVGAEEGRSKPAHLRQSARRSILVRYTLPATCLTYYYYYYYYYHYPAV